MRILTFDTIDELAAHAGFSASGRILEDDIDVVETECDLNGRRRRDAEVLVTVAANVSGACLDLGTSHGHSAFRIASNLEERGLVHTVNILPEQYNATGGVLITHLLGRDEIGAFYRARGMKNIRQHYANTACWDVPPEISELSMVFVDAAHDTEMVYGDSRLIWPRVRPGGWVLWHDFNPSLRRRFDWIDASMKGVERFLGEACPDAEILHLRHSWVALVRKPEISAVVPLRLDVPSPPADPASLPPRQDAPQPAPEMRLLRYVLAYPAYASARIAKEEALASRLRSLGYDVEAFPIPCPGGWWPFPQLDHAWNSGDAHLRMAYDALEAKLGSRGVLIALGGSMLHPRFVESLRSKAYTVFLCADDPESSEQLSRPVAASFDHAMPTNLACLEDYVRWGCRRVDWIFHPVDPALTAPRLTAEAILEGERSLDVALFCEKVLNLSDRARRIEELLAAFPQAFVRGRGWPGGYLPEAEMRLACLDAKIGWNLHNSVGPTNSRTTMLPALGVMQICDNKERLGRLFEPDVEIVGFDNVRECVDKTRYYLDHDRERREIAARGWARATSEYTEAGWWRRILARIGPFALAELS
jgi:predicted O-methyltransferase YrrM